jgi:hypothetical protein
MNKRYKLVPYEYYFRNWRGLALLLLALSLVLLVLEPPAIAGYRSVLQLSAGLGALVYMLGFAMASLAFVTVGKKAVVIQLPLWRVRLPMDFIQSTRLVTLGGLSPGRWKDVEMADLSALLVELKQWPQARQVMRFWLGGLVLFEGIALPVDDVLGLRRAVDAQLLDMNEGGREPLPIRQY